jgi:hypothetical protein
MMPPLLILAAKARPPEADMPWWMWLVIPPLVVIGAALMVAMRGPKV